MSYLNHDQIVQACEAGAIDLWSADCVNAASLDLRLGETIFLERNDPNTWGKPTRLDYRARDKMLMREYALGNQGILILPGEFFLAHTVELCNFPDNLAALFRIKSSMGRMGLEHMDAGWVDPGFHGALTLEFKNMTQHHAILLRPGDKIGQLIFFRGDQVAEDQSYRAKGNYNGQSGIMQAGYKGDK